MSTPLSFRSDEDLLREPGIDICHETVRYWWNRFDQMIVRETRKKRIHFLTNNSKWKWHLDEVFVKVNGETHYLWPAAVEKAPCKLPKPAKLKNFVLTGQGHHFRQVTEWASCSSDLRPSELLRFKKPICPIFRSPVV